MIVGNYLHNYEAIKILILYKYEEVLEILFKKHSEK